MAQPPGKQFKTTRIVALQCDINRVGSIPEALQKAGVFGPVRGVLHGAACFDGDKLFRNVSDEAFEATLKPKVHGSLALLATATHAKWELDFFTYLSSVVVSLGNLGQTAYAGHSLPLGSEQVTEILRISAILFSVLFVASLFHDKIFTFYFDDRSEWLPSGPGMLAGFLFFPVQVPSGQFHRPERGAGLSFSPVQFPKFLVTWPVFLRGLAPPV